VPAFAAAAAALGTELTLARGVRTISGVDAHLGAGVRPCTEGERLRIRSHGRRTLAIHLSVHVLDDVGRALIPPHGEDCLVANRCAQLADQKVVSGNFGAP